MRAPITVDAKVAKQQHGKNAQQGRGKLRSADTLHQNEHNGRGKSRHRIVIALLENSRGLAAEHIAQRAAANRRDNGKQNGHDHSQAARHGLAAAGSREQRYRDGITKRDGGRQVPENALEVEHENAQTGAHHNEAGMVDKVHAMGLQQDVADDAAAIAGDQAQSDGSDNIELTIDRVKRARQHADKDEEVLDSHRNRERLRREQQFKELVHPSPFLIARTPY